MPWTPTLSTVLRGSAKGPVTFGRRRLYVCTEEVVREFLLSTGEYGKTFPAAGVAVLAASPDGTRLATFQKNGKARVWDTLSGKAVGELETPRSPVSAAAISRDNRYVYMGRRNGSLLVQDLEHVRDAEYVSTAAPSVTALSAGYNDKFLYVGHGNGVVGRWGLPEFTQEDSLATGRGRILHVGASRDDETVYACTADLSVVTIDVDSEDQFTLYRGPKTNLAFAIPTPNYRRLYTASKTGSIAVWNLEHLHLHTRVRNLNGSIDGFAVSNDGTRLAVATGGDVYIWALDEAWRNGSREPVTALAQAADGKRLWIARPDHSIELWDSENGRSLARWPAHAATITALAVDGEQLLSASLDGTIAVWPLGGDLS